MTKRNLDLDDYVEDYDDTVEFHLDILKKAQENLIEQGIFPAPQPLTKKGKPIRPAIPAGQISGMSPTDIIDLLSEIAAYTEYLAGQSVEKIAIAKAYSEALADIVSKIRLRTRGSPAHVSDVVRTDPRYLKARPKALEKEYEADYTKSYLEGMEKPYAVVSRAITYHEIERGVVRRENNNGGGNRGTKSKYKDIGAPEFRKRDK